MIAKTMVVRCSKCGRTFIRSMSSTQGFLGRASSLVCWKCQSSNTGGLTVGDVLKKALNKNRKK